MIGGESLGFWSMASMIFGLVSLLGIFGGILFGL